jgi:hypothetical protein
MPRKNSHRIVGSQLRTASGSLLKKDFERAVASRVRNHCSPRARFLVASLLGTAS